MSKILLNEYQDAGHDIGPTSSSVIIRLHTLRIKRSLYSSVCQTSIAGQQCYLQEVKSACEDYDLVNRLFGTIALTISEEQCRERCFDTELREGLANPRSLQPRQQ